MTITRYLPAVVLAAAMVGPAAAQTGFRPYSPPGRTASVVPSVLPDGGEEVSSLPGRPTIGENGLERLTKTQTPPPTTAVVGGGVCVLVRRSSPFSPIVGRPGRDDTSSPPSGRTDGTTLAVRPGGEYGRKPVWAAAGPTIAAASTTAGRYRVIVMRPSPCRPTAAPSLVRRFVTVRSARRPGRL